MGRRKRRIRAERGATAAKRMPRCISAGGLNPSAESDPSGCRQLSHGWWQLAAIATFGRLVGAGVENHFPGAVRLLSPDSHIAAGCGYGIPIGILAVSLEVPPGVAHVSGRSHHRIGWGPGKLVGLGVPVSGLGTFHA